MRSGGWRAHHIALIRIAKYITESVSICSPKKVIVQPFSFSNKQNASVRGKVIKGIKGYGISDNLITFYNPFDLETIRIRYLLEKPIQ